MGLEFRTTLTDVSAHGRQAQGSGWILIFDDLPLTELAEVILSNSLFAFGLYGIMSLVKKISK